MHSSCLPEGVYYARESYAGFWRRLVVDVIDISLMLAISVGVTLLITSILPLSEGLIMMLFGLWATL